MMLLLVLLWPVCTREKKTQLGWALHHIASQTGKEQGWSGEPAARSNKGQGSGVEVNRALLPQSLFDVCTRAWEARKYLFLSFFLSIFLSFWWGALFGLLGRSLSPPLQRERAVALPARCSYSPFDARARAGRTKEREWEGQVPKASSA